jgi:hypothetical protein
MVGSVDDDERMPPQSPHMKGIVQDLVREVKKHTEDLDVDVHATNEKIDVSEATQLATNTMLRTMEASVAHINTSLTALLRCFDDLMIRDHDRHQGHNDNNNFDEQIEDNWDEYSANLEFDDHDAHHQVYHIRHGKGGHR